MKYDRELVFSWIEEDNTQRAYFRLKPLLTPSGDVQAEAAALWPDEGALRIVPDKNEQGYFKDRMRALGHFCVMDLTPFPAEANKIRTNKNYRPEKEERNQFILYSDTVKPLPEHTFFELLEGHPEDAKALAEAAATPLFMIREGDTLFGPISKHAPLSPTPAPEMAATIYDITCPDGKVRTILCQAQAAQEKTVLATQAAEECPPPPEEAPLPLGKPLNILDQSKNFNETLEGLNQPLSQGANLLHQQQAQPEMEPVVRQALTGTPLMRNTVLRTSVPRPKNRVQEVVANQIRAARNDPPAAPLPAGATLRAVDNPVEHACAQLQQAWQLPEAQQQLVDFILSLPGMSARLMPALASPQGETPLQKALQRRLEDLEAERLAALVQLDNARENLEAFRRSAVEGARADVTQQLNDLQGQVKIYEERLEAIREQLNALATQRDVLLQEISRLQQDTLPAALAEALAKARLVAPVSGQPIYLHMRSGKRSSVTVLIQQLMDGLQRSGVMCSRNTAVALWALLTCCKRFGLVSAVPAPVATLCENMVGALGWRSGYGFQTSADQQPVLDAPMEDGTPLLMLSTLPVFYRTHGLTRLMLSRSVDTMVHSQAYEADPWPILPVPDLPFIAQAEPAADGQPLALPICHDSIEEEALTAIRNVMQPLLSVLPPLSGCAAKEMEQFIHLCAVHMDGGLAAACDWAIMLWLVPAVDGNQELQTALEPLLAEYPLSAARV